MGAGPGTGRPDNVWSLAFVQSIPTDKRNADDGAVGDDSPVQSHRRRAHVSRSVAGPLLENPSTRRKEEETQKSQSSSSVATALPMTYDEPDPEKKSWFSSAFGDSADRIAGFTLVTVDGNMAS